MYSLKELHIKAKTAPTIDKSFGNYPDGDIRGFVSPDETKYSQKTNATLYVPKGCLYSYKSWGKYFNNIIEE